MLQLNCLTILEKDEKVKRDEVGWKEVAFEFRYN